jgi:hypothetical protein
LAGVVNSLDEILIGVLARTFDNDVPSCDEDQTVLLIIVSRG